MAAIRDPSGEVGHRGHRDSGAAAVSRPGLRSGNLGRPPVKGEVEPSEPTNHPLRRHSDGLWIASRGVGRILEDPCFWITITAVGTVTAVGCLGSGRTGRRRAADLLGLVALGELAWHGFAVLQVAPAETFFRPDPISQSLVSLSSRSVWDQPPRVRARDSFFLDLQAVRYGIDKTNINDVFQLQHAAALYEPLYAVATTKSEPRRLRCRLPSAITGGRFDRESSTGWP